MLIHKHIKYNARKESWVHVFYIRATSLQEALDMVLENYCHPYGSGIPGGVFHDDPYTVSWNGPRKCYVIEQFGGFDI